MTDKKISKSNKFSDNIESDATDLNDEDNDKSEEMSDQDTYKDDTIEDLEDQEDQEEPIDESDQSDDTDDDLEDDLEIDDEDRKISEDEKSYDSDVFEEKCLYKYADNKSDTEDDDIDNELIYDDDFQETNKIVLPEERITKPYLTKYEKVRIIGDRTKQLAGGAKPMIKDVEHLSSLEIALLELKHNIIPIIIERPLPNGKKERWNVSELIH